MLEIRRGLSVRSYENTFFREFAKNLSDLFDRYNLKGVLLGNPQCLLSDNLQIDALLLVNNAICIIDFKNFGGRINLPPPLSFESEIWTNEANDMIKGGSHINPYKQLTQQKKAFTWVYHNSKLKTELGKNFNPSHTKKIVCFHNPITINGVIPPKDEIDFFITDKNSYLNVIKDIIDVIDEEVDLDQHAFDIFKEIFIAEPFSLTEVYDDEPIADLPTIEDGLDYSKLLPHQTEVLKFTNEFIKQENEKVLILQGPTHSGKSYLTGFIKELAFKSGIQQVVNLAPTYKIIKNLLKADDDINSMYSYIYGGKSEAIENDTDNPDINETPLIELISIKECQDEDDTLYIVDEAHLISNSFSQSFNRRFGSGRLLADFIEFIKLDKYDRKIIFIGDPYHTKIGDKSESSLNKDFYLSHYGFSPKIIKMPLLHDLYKGNAIVERLISSIDSQYFNHLTIDQSDNITLINKDQSVHNDKVRTSKIRALIKDHLKDSFKILSYSNKTCLEVNQWIKKSILKNGADLATDDLLLINNNFYAPILDDSINQLKKIYNGDFASICNIGHSETKIIPIKNGSTIALTFRELSLKHHESGNIFRVYSLENYREGEFLDEEKLALTILVNMELNLALKESPFEGSTIELKMLRSKSYHTQKEIISKLESAQQKGERVKTRLEKERRTLRKIERQYRHRYKNFLESILSLDSTTNYFKYKNCAFLRFGWCMTVHKALSYKWQHLLFDADPENRGVTNEAYFSWLYSGLTRARNKVTLINFTSITPFIKSEVIDKATIKTLPYLIFDNSVDILMPDELTSSNDRSFADHPFKNIIIQLYQFVEKLISADNLKISSVTHNNYQEIFHITDGAHSVKVIFSYNKKGIINYQIPAGKSEELNGRIHQLLLTYDGIKDFSQLNLDWRANCYQLLNHKLNERGYSIHWVNTSPYKDSIKIANEESFAGVEFNYDANGFFSKINITTISDHTIQNSVTTILRALKDEV